MISSRLGVERGCTRYRYRRLARAVAGTVQQNPMAHTHLMLGVDFGVGPSLEIVIVGEPDRDDTQAMVVALRRQFMPNRVLLRHPSDDAPIIDLAGFTASQYQLEDCATAYVCLNYVCRQPTNDVDTMLALLENP